MRAGTTVLENGDIRIVIPIEPKTKKNSQRIFYRKTTDQKSGEQKKVPFIIPSSQYSGYAKDCMFFLKRLGINEPVNVAALFFMKTKRRVDLTNLNESLHDVLVAGGVLEDDNCNIIVSTDGSRVFHDKENPRTEVLITMVRKTF